MRTREKTDGREKREREREKQSWVIRDHCIYTSSKCSF